MDITPNDFQGTDSERIAQALAVVERQGGGLVRIPRRKDPDGRAFWLIDEAILLKANTTLLIENCTIKRSDRCRDNFVRSANCGIGIENPSPLENIHIIGIGNAVFEGADHPRATGDASKTLACPCPKNFTGAENPDFWSCHRHSYGTDAGRDGQSQTGDWRNVGILMANVHHLSIENLRIVEPHAWAISLEACSFATICRIDFSARMARVIDGEEHNVENQDGIDLRRDCHDICISDITGTTGDDVVALTANPANPYFTAPAGSLDSTEVMSRREGDVPLGIWNVTICNVKAHSAGGCYILRFLALSGARICNVQVDGIVDTSPDDFHSTASIMMGGWPGVVGEPGFPYGKQEECSLFDILLSNVISNAQNCVVVPGGLQNSFVSNILRRNPEATTIRCDNPQLLQNCHLPPN